MSHSHETAASNTSNAREYRPALRDDVQALWVEDLGWMLHNRQDGRYSRISELGQKLIGKLDGRHTIADLHAYSEQHLRRPVPAATVEAFVTSLRTQGMLSDAEGRVAPRKGWLDKLLNPRLRVVRGERSVGRVTSWLLSIPRNVRNVVLVGLLVWGVVAPFVLFLSDQLGRSPRLRELPGLMAPLALLLIVLEMAMHELAHGVALTVCGGTVRDLGIGLRYLVFPYSYTNTTDGYRLGRRERIFVSLAGPMVELVLIGLNSAALMLLPAGHPARLLLMCLIAFELSALIVNANPLLPFDGYFVLADALREPDLRTQALAYLRGRLKALVGRSGPTRAYTRRQQVIYAVYGSIAGLYLALIFVSLAVLAVALSYWLGMRLQSPA